MDKLEPWVQTIDSFLGIESPTIEPGTTVVEEPEVEDNMTLTTSTKTVEILGTRPGFEFYMSSDSYVYFETEQWSYVEYSLQVRLWITMVRLSTTHMFRMRSLDTSIQLICLLRI